MDRRFSVCRIPATSGSIKMQPAKRNRLRETPMLYGVLLDSRQIAKALTDADYSSKVGFPTVFRDFQVPSAGGLIALLSFQPLQRLAGSAFDTFQFLPCREHRRNAFDAGGIRDLWLVVIYDLAADLWSERDLCIPFFGVILAIGSVRDWSTKIEAGSLARDTIRSRTSAMTSPSASPPSSPAEPADQSASSLARSSRSSRLELDIGHPSGSVCAGSTVGVNGMPLHTQSV
jgi:hypothetical protein